MDTFNDLAAFDLRPIPFVYAYSDASDVCQLVS